MTQSELDDPNDDEDSHPYANLNSIEKLTNIDGPVIEISQWQLIQTIDSFRPRHTAIFCAWNEHELVVLGGAINAQEYFNDKWVFDSRTETMRQIIQP